MEKQCTKCKERKLLSAFGRHRQGRNGLYARCRECRKIYDRKYYQEHREQCLVKDKEYQRTIIGCLRRRFKDMKRRCNNPRNKYYGGRGIKCLFESSDEFVNYVIGILQIDPRDLQIDRIDNDGNYEPGNIRFVTASENQKNKRK